MSIINGAITQDGATILVLVGVSLNRRRALEKMGFPVPQEIVVNAQLDTGSFITGFTPELFQTLGVGPVDEIAIHTPSTRRGQPCNCPLFDVGVTLVSGTDRYTLPSITVIETGGFEHGEPVQAIIGRDILNRCVFQYNGPHRDFSLFF